MDTTEETPEEAITPAPEITPASAGSFGRPFAPGVSGNPGGRPKDPIAAFLRDMTDGGKEVAEFLVAVIRDDVDGRIADKGGLCDRMEIDASIAEAEAKKARDDGDVFRIATHEAKARELRARAKAFRAKLARKRKIAVAVKVRVAAAQIFFDRAFGKARETVDLTIGNPDGSPMGVKSPGAPGALAHLSALDLADIGTAMGAVLDRAGKRVTLEAEPLPPTPEEE